MRSSTTRQVTGPPTRRHEQRAQREMREIERAKAVAGPAGINPAVEVLVEAAESPFEKDSSIRLDQIRVISIEKRIHSVLGSLDTESIEAVDEALKLSLGLD